MLTWSRSSISFDSTRTFFRCRRVANISLIGANPAISLRAHSTRNGGEPVAT